MLTNSQEGQPEKRKILKQFVKILKIRTQFKTQDNFETY
jgi:hypothetical protein